MKNFIFFFLLISSFVFSQKKDTEKTDSITYYTQYSNRSLKENKYYNAIFYIQKAIRFSEKTNQIDVLNTQNFNLGKLYYDLKKYNLAFNSFEKCISNSRNTITKTQAQTYYYLGMCSMRNKEIQSANLYFQKAKILFNLLKITDFDDLIQLQSGVICKENGDFEKAFMIFNTLLINSNEPKKTDTKTEALYQMGLIELAQNKHILAKNYFKKALALNLKNPEQKSNILLALSNVSEKLSDENNAYFYLKQYNNIRESILISNNEKLGIDDYKKYKESQRIKEETKLKKEKIQKEKSNKFSKLISILAIALISILSLLSLSLYKNNIIRTRSNQLLEEKNKELILAKEKTEKASNARTEFLSTVSHELRTPLNAINGIAHLLLEENPKKSQMHYLESLQFSGNYLTTFINDILEINKIDSRKALVENIHFNLKLLLTNIQNSLKELALQNDNNFSFEIDPNIPDYLIGDPTKLSQVLMNLINNALKFTHNGEVVVLSKLKLLENQNTLIYFEVKDTGIGIPEDKLESVFDSFSQGSVGINRKYGGTGLGLTIVKKLVKILGGNIKLKSIVKEGSSFSFELPFQIGSKPIKIDKKTKKTHNSILSNKKILVVEDNKINQMISKKMLESKGMICEIIDNGEDAVEIIRCNSFDLILMDVHLPGINGTIATKKIRKFNTDVPIVALTAISLNENRDMLLSYGMNDVITKPFVPENFYDVISKYI